MRRHMITISGEMPERPKGVDSKSTASLWRRGFESLSLRHLKKSSACLFKLKGLTYELAQQVEGSTKYCDLMVKGSWLWKLNNC
jgi:hypothetical protein